MKRFPWDVIKEVGPRSDFLAHMNTFENMYIQSKPKLIDRLTRDRWIEAGHLDMESRALIAAKELLATWEPEPLSEEACARVRQCSTPPNVTTACRKAWSKNKEGEGNRQYCLLLLRVLGHTSISATSPAISGVLDKRAPEILPSSSHGLGSINPSFLNTSPALFPLPAGAFSSGRKDGTGQEAPNTHPDEQEHQQLARRYGVRA